MPSDSTSQAVTASPRAAHARLPSSDSMMRRRLATVRRSVRPSAADQRTIVQDRDLGAGRYQRRALGVEAELVTFCGKPRRVGPCHGLPQVENVAITAVRTRLPSPTKAKGPPWDSRAWRWLSGSLHTSAVPLLLEAASLCDRRQCPAQRASRPGKTGYDVALARVPDLHLRGTRAPDGEPLAVWTESKQCATGWPLDLGQRRGHGLDVEDLQLARGRVHRQQSTIRTELQGRPVADGGKDGRGTWAWRRQRQSQRPRTLLTASAWLSGLKRIRI